MIVVQISDPYLRAAALRAAGRDEDVIADPDRAAEALDRGYPRLLVREAGGPRVQSDPAVRLMEISGPLLRRWDQEWRAKAPPQSRLDYVASRLSVLMARDGSERTWVDRTLADLARASGRRLPEPLRQFGRRVLEFPSLYTTLHPLAEVCGTTRGALKARFRRRGLASPATYLRWFRILSVAEVLSDPDVTVAAAARRLGFTSNGNLCRTMWNVTEMTPTEVRTSPGRNGLLLAFAWRYCSPDALDAWASLDDLFDRRVA